MLKNFLKSSIYLIALTLVSTVGAVLIHSVLAYVNPTADPPGGNVENLLNTSATAQTKSGDLTANKLTASAGGLCLGADCKTAWSQVAGTASGWTDGGTSVYLSTLTDLVGIGTNAPNKQLHLKTATGNAEMDIQSASQNYWALYHDITTEQLRFWNADFAGNVGAGVGNAFVIDNDGVVLAKTPSVSDPDNAVATKGYVDAAILGGSIGSQYYQSGVDYYGQGGNLNYCQKLVISADGVATYTNVHDGLVCDTNKACLSGQCLDSTGTCYFDADGDGYGGGTQYYGAICNTSGYVINNTDCSTADATRWRNKYVDGDVDGYGAGSAVCVGNHTGYVDNNTDCYDSNASAYPGQASLFTTHRGDGSFDYNCNGVLYYDLNCVTTLPDSTSCFAGSLSKTPGWVGSVAACGQSATARYFTSWYNSSCTNGGYNSWSCTGSTYYYDYATATNYTRTQSCN